MLLFLSNFYREIFTAQTDIFGQIMRIVEIACIPLYLFQILMSIELVCTAMIRWAVEVDMTDEKIQELFFTGTDLRNNILYKKCPLKEFNAIQGSTNEWLIVEIAIFGYFLLTMLLTMFKSRFWKVGMDNSGQFEDTNMSYLCNRIIKNIDFTISQDPRAFYVDKERLV